MKRFLTLYLAVLLALSCVFASADTVDWTTPYEEPVDIHVALLEQSNHIFPEGEDFFNNMWWDYFRENYNVNVIVDWVSNEYNTKLNLAIASGDLSDAFHCSPVQLNQLMDAGLLAPLNEAYESTVSDTVRHMMDFRADAVDVAVRDGTMYGIPWLSYGLECMTNFLWVRKDWAEETGFTGFETLDDLTNLMDTFMNEKGAQYGLTLEKGLSAFTASAVIFDAQPGIWVEGKDGTLVYGSTQPEMKDALQWWADLYANGYIRSDFGTMDQSQANEDVYNGKAGLTFFYQWGGWAFGQDMIKNQGENSYMIPYELPKDVNGELVQYPVTFDVGNYNVVRQGYEHPEAAIKLIDAYCYLMNEAVALGTMTAEEVLPYNTNEMQHVPNAFKLEFGSYDDAHDVCDALETGVEKFRSGYGIIYYNEAKAWTENGDPTGLGRYLQMGPGGSVRMACDQIDRGQIHRDAVWGATPQAVLDYGSTLNDILTEGFTMIILGNESVDYFDTVVESWKAAGGDVVTAAVNEMYGNK
jgi:putative aldouronate transport system substrate-binding protein